MEDKTLEKNKPEDISKCQPYDRGQLAKLLSYHPTIDVRPYMKEGTVMDCFYHSIFQLYHDLVFLVCFYNDDEKDGKYN